MVHNGLHAHPLLAMQLFDVYVRPVLSYGVEIWGPGLAVASLSGKGADACERVHLSFLRQLLGVSDRCSALTVLAETGRMPLAVAWAKQTIRFAKRVVGFEDTRVAKQALLDSVALAAAGGAAGRGRQCWAAEVGQLCDLLAQPAGFLWGQLPEELDADEAHECAQEKHYGRYRGEGAPAMVQRYRDHILGAEVGLTTYLFAPYLTSVPDRCCRAELARVRLGCSKLVPEDEGRMKALDRSHRPCPCGAALGSTVHVLLECPLFEGVRAQFPGLFAEGQTLATFLGQEDQVAVARYVRLCHQVGV